LTHKAEIELLQQSSATRENLGLLAVMEALEDGDRITQRELARVTGLNLKKVNYCLHKLLEKGYVKFQRVRNNPDKRAYLYILTPAGMKAKSRLTYRFVKFTLDFYGRMEEKLGNSLRAMEEAGVRRVLLYGANDVARILLDLARGNGIEVVGIVDSGHSGGDFYSVPVSVSADLQDNGWDAILITTLDEPDQVDEELAGLGIPREAIWRLT
jgi:DNA-binding MarR family transcriptional regulator